MYWVLYTSSIQHKDREHGEKGKLSPEIRHILALAPLSLQRTPQSSLCAGDGASLTPPAEAGSSGRRAGTSFMSELSAGNAPSLPGSPALPAAPSAALNKFSPLGGKRVNGTSFHMKSLSLSRSLTHLCLRTRTKRMMKKSQRRSYWRWDATAGCGCRLQASRLEEENKTTSRCVQRKTRKTTLCSMAVVFGHFSTPGPV